MSGTQLAAIVSILGALLLFGSGLRARGLGARRGWRLAAIWLAIILAVWAAVTFGMHFV